jgi:hypothetical protein
MAYLNYCPLDIQLEILKYNPCFRRLNKLFHVEGKQIFDQMYSNLPISKQEYKKYIKTIKDDYYIPAIVYNNMSVNIMSINIMYNDTIDSSYNIKYYPEAINPKFYISSIKMVKNSTLKALTNSYNIYDTITSLMILDKRGNVITEKYIDEFLDNICRKDIINKDNQDIDIYLNLIFTYNYMKSNANMLMCKNIEISESYNVSFKGGSAININTFQESISVLLHEIEELKIIVKTQLLQLFQ